jgi:predicted O-methyltransferase YrrM
MTSTKAFDLDTSRTYWRYAPSGAGKHDTVTLAAQRDKELCATWDDGFLKRFRGYPEEAEFLRVMAKEFSGRKILSIGSGIGLHEIYYALHGASVTCCDIVPSNLEFISRVARTKKVRDLQTLVSTGANQDLGGPYDIIFLCGSLMTMPETMQRQLLSRCVSALHPEGKLIFMLYTWEFARATCGWESPDEFDPAIFARASDPSVGSEHCPWSDWHDEAKLLALVGDQFHVTRQQLWNQGWYVWYELSRQAPAARAGHFFDPSDVAAGRVVATVPLSPMVVAEAEMALLVTTTANNFSYALVGPAQAQTRETAPVDTIVVEATLEDGAFSIGVLDEAKNSFVFSQGIWQPGRHRHVFSCGRLPARYRVIVSNFRHGAPAKSQFLLHRIEFLEKPERENDLLKVVGSSRVAGSQSA